MNVIKSILVADDDPAICDSIQFLLEDEGFKVSTTLDGEILYKMEKDFPDLLLLDIWMSGYDGRHICKFWKKNKKTKDIPIIFISASRDIADSAKEYGADDFLSKPFQLDDLVKKVKTYLKKNNKK